jgi:hypothetical protein
MANVNNTFIDSNIFVTHDKICQSCYKGELIPIDHEGLLVCNICSNSIRFIFENDKPSYKEPPKEISFYAYKRINHFREILSQFQAKESTDIPSSVIEMIQQQIIQNVQQLNNINKHVEKILLEHKQLINILMKDNFDLKNKVSVLENNLKLISNTKL